jgi:hypothetical protein
MLYRPFSDATSSWTRLLLPPELSRKVCLPPAHADLAMKEKALARVEEPVTRLRRYRPPDALLTFLQQL